MRARVADLVLATRMILTTKANNIKIIKWLATNRSTLTKMVKSNTMSKKWLMITSNSKNKSMSNKTKRCQINPKQVMLSYSKSKNKNKSMSKSLLRNHR